MKRAASNEAKRKGKRRGFCFPDDAPVALAELDASGGLGRTSARFRALAGRNEASLEGEALVALLHEDDRDGHRRALEALASGRESYRRDERYLRPDGTVAWATNELTRLAPGEGFLLAASAAAVLAARAEAARERAEAEVRHRDDFLSVLSHELRSPLAVILVWTRLLRDTEGGVDAARGLDVIERSGRALERILDDLGHASHISAGKLALTTRCTFDLRTAAQSAVDALAREAASKGVLLEARLPSAPVVVDGDARRLQQAVTNVVANAVAFTAAGGRVEVGMETRAGEALVRVADTGEGMDAAFLPLAFERFRQGDSAPTRSHHGLGLGLYIARHLTELHGGRIAAESPGRGRGSTFTIILPLAAPAVVAGSAPGPSGPARLPPGLRVLVVDDDDDAREALRLLLKLGGAEVETAASVAEAIEAMRRRRPEVVLSDIAMPGEDGLSLIRRVRALAPDEGVAVRAVALTAYASAVERDAALHAGFDLHVAKPVDPPELLRMVASLAGRRSG